MLGLERLVGIGWDYHPDSVTYATVSTETVHEILSGDWILIFNNGYYFWCHLFSENIYILTALNMLMYALTNVHLYKFHKSFFDDNSKNKWLFALIILLINPYRLHLSTTLLKDTLIIFLMVLVAKNGFKRGIIFIPLLFVVRVASLLYTFIFLKRRYLFTIFALALLLIMVSPQLVIERLMEFNEAEMQLREFDRIPTFQEYGLVGIAMRGILWPILAVSGLFVVISPALAFFPVAIGSLLNQVYCYMAVNKFSFPITIFSSMALFGLLVTGFTAYIRYVYPLLVILPIITLKNAIRDHDV